MRLERYDLDGLLIEVVEDGQPDPASDDPAEMIAALQAQIDELLIALGGGNE